MTAPRETIDFFNERFRQLAPHERIELRTLHPKGRPGPRSWHDNPLTAAAAAFKFPLGPSIYYGVCPRRDGGGKKEHVTSTSALWGDVDFKHFGDDPARTLAALDAFPLRPTWIIDSGGGFQVYWELIAPLPVAGPADPVIGSIEGLLRRLYARLGGLDSVQDLSRILRVPGTLNPKYDPPRLVTIARHEPLHRYTLSDFEALLPPPPPPKWDPERPLVLPPPAAPHGHGGTPSPDEVRDLLRHIPPRGDYQDDWLRVLAAVHSIYPGPDGVALCEEWSPGTPGEIARKFASFGRTAGRKAGVGTLVYLAKQGGWRRPARVRIVLPPREPGHRPALSLTPQTTIERRATRLAPQGDDHAR